MKQKMSISVQKLTKKTSKFLFASLAVVLALAIGFLAHFQMFGSLVRAKEAPVQYIGEVRVYQGKTAEAAAEACKKDGFTPVEGKYIFFSPTEKYTSGTEYISGLFFVSGANAKEAGWSLEDYAEKLGGKLLGKENFAKERQWHKKVMGPESGMNCYVKYYMESAVKDLYVYVGENPEKHLTIDKRKYTLCGNRNLNYGTGMLYDIGKPEKYGWMCTSGIPVRVKSGEVTGFILADITLDNVVSGIWRFVLQYTVGLLLVIALFGFLMMRYMKNTVVKPINDITEASQNFAADKKAGV